MGREMGVAAVVAGAWLFKVCALWRGLWAAEARRGLGWRVLPPSTGGPPEAAAGPGLGLLVGPEHHVLRSDGRRRARSASVAGAPSRWPSRFSAALASGWVRARAVSALRAGPYSRALLEARGWVRALLLQQGVDRAAGPPQPGGAGGPRVLLSARCGRAQAQGRSACVVVSAKEVYM